MFTANEVDQATRTVRHDPSMGITGEHDISYCVTVTRALLHELRDSGDWFTRRRVRRAIGVLEEIVNARVR